MSNLRQPLFVDINTSPEDRLAAEVAGQTSLRRNYSAGRLGTEANNLAAEEASLRASGRNAEADALRREIGVIQARQSAVASEVSDIRQIDGIGSLGSFVAGQVGQGVASMQDSALVALGTAAATRLRPIAQAMGRAARLAPGAAAFGVNQRQMTGEFYNNAVQDPTIMATHSAQDLNRVANAYGAAGGLIDTLPLAAAARRAVGGAGLLPTSLRQAGVPLGGRIALDMAGEGATEGLQQFGQQQTLGMLNPNRDTSEDGWELANAAVGGALGGGPLAAGSRVAEGVRERAGAAVNAVGGKAGDTFDLGSGQPTDSPSGGSPSRLERMRKMFTREEVDLGQGADNAQAPAAAPAAPRLTPEDLDLLNVEPPEDMSAPGAVEQVMQDLERAGEVAQRYLQGANDPEAQAILARLSPDNPDPSDRRDAQISAARVVTKRSKEDALVRRAEQGSAGERAVQMAAGAAAQGAKRVAGAVLKLGKAAWRGVQDAATKKNLQATDDKVQRLGDNLGAFLRGETSGVPLSQRSSKLGQHFQRLGEDLGDLIETSETNIKSRKSPRILAPRLLMQAMDMADDLMTAFGREGAVAKVNEMRSIAGGQGKLVLDQLQTLVSGTARDINIAKARNERELGLSLIKHMDPVQAQEAYGSADIRRALIKAVDSVSRGVVTPAQRAAVVRAVGGNAQLDAMLREYNGNLMEADPDAPGNEAAVDDRGEGGDGVESDDLRPDAPAPKSTKAPTRVYGFHKTGKLRTENAFAAEAGENDERVRPRLFTLDTEVTVDTPTGKAKANAIQKKIEDVTKSLGKRAGDYKVDKKSALDAMRDEGLSGDQMLLVYRDYLRMDAKSDLPEVARRTMLKDARTAAAMFLDRTQGPTTIGDGRKMYRVKPMDAVQLEERMTEYFANRFVVTAEGVTDSEVEVMDIKAFTKMTDAARKVVDYSRKYQKDGKGPAAEVLDERNVIFFDRKGEAIPVLADDLVKWGRKQRKASEAADLVSNAGADELANSARNKQFIQDLSMGMAAVLDSGLVDSKLPWKVNAEGEQEKFGDRFRPQKVGSGTIPSSQLPPSLRLATTTVSGAEFAKAKKAEKGLDGTKAERKDWEAMTPEERAARDEELTKKQQARVAKDQDRGEPWVADDAPPESDAPLRETEFRRAVTDDELKQMRGMDLAQRQAMLRSIVRQEKRRAEAAARSKGAKRAEAAEEGREVARDLQTEMTLTGTVGAKFNPNAGSGRGGMDDTPLDFFGEDRRDKELQSIPDEFSQQRIQSRSEGFDAAQSARPPVTAAQAKRFAERDAQEIIKALTPLPEGANVVQAPGALGRPEEGLAMIESRLKSAARPKSDPKGLVGGIHYIYPVVKALNGDQLGTYDLGPQAMAALQRMRERTAQVLLDADMPAQERVRLAKELATAQAAGRITAQNVRTALQRMAGTPEATSPVTVKQEPAAPAAPTAPTADRAYEREVMDRVLKENYAGLDTKADMDKFLKTAHAMWQRGKAREAEMNRLAESQDDAEQARAEKALQLLRALDGTFKEGGYAQTDLGSFYEGIADMSDADVRAMLAGSEVPTQAPKSSSAPAGARNAQTGTTGDNSQAAQAQAIEYVNKVLPGVKVAFKDITGYSGEWIEAENLIVVARQSAPGAMQTAYHEAMHAFFSKFLKNNPEAMRTMRALAENPKVMQRVVALLSKYPAALKQLQDGEERLAYIYQFWAAGLLELPQGRPQTLMQKVRKFLRRAAGMITDTERAVEILEAFHSGELAKPSYAGRVMADIINQGTMTTKARRKFDKQLQAVYAAAVPAETVLATSASATARRLAKQFFTNPGDEDSAGDEPGYMNARRVVASQYSNRFARIVDGMTKKDMEEITKLLQQKVKPEDIAHVPHRRAVERIRDLLGNFYEYMSDGRGLPVADAGRDYFPTVWDFDKLVEKKKEFIDLVTNKYKRDGEELWNHMVGATSKAQAQKDVTHAGGVLNPFFAGKEKIELPWFEAADRERFLQKDLVGIMTTYFHRGARAAEYHHRFGEDGILLQKALKTVEKELKEHAAKELKDGKFDDAQQAEAWAARQYKQITNATAAMEGSLGKDTDEKWRKATSWITAYQNVRLLPLTLFASFVDPLNMVARGATMKEAYETFLRGMTEVFRNWRNMMRSEPEPTKMDRWTKLAEDIGAVDSLMFSEFVSEQYSSGYMAPGAKKLNDWFFRINGMEAWNRGMRSGAVRSAVRFIERHTKTPETHSTRWLKELGLTAADVKLDADGELITDVKGMVAAGLSPTQAREATAKIHQAINRWVEGAVLTPNAAQRPSWASDPRWSFMFHLKQFSYSFHQTILKRAVREMNHGNMAPLGSFLWYVPTMIAADIFKGLIQGGGELPPSMQGMTAGDWVMRGIERAGFLGVPGIALEGVGDPASLLGPAPDQVFDALTDPADKTVLRALPGMPLYSNWVQ